MANPGEFYVTTLYRDGSLLTVEDVFFPPPSSHSETTLVRNAPNGLDFYQRSPNSNNLRDDSGWRPPSPFVHYRFYCTRSNPSSSFSVIRRAADLSVREVITAEGSYTEDDASMETPRWPLSSKLVDSAVSKALLKLQDQTINLATNLAERKQSVALIEHGIRTLAAAVNVFRRHKPKAWAQARKDSHRRGTNFDGSTPSNSWLEFQYGLKPTLQDIYGAVKRIKDGDPNGDAARVTVVATSKENESWIWYKPAGFSVATQINSSQESLVHVSLSYFQNNTFLASLSSLGLTNPAYVLFEETPFSFVLDWALPVGNFIQALSADFGWEFKGGTMSQKATYVSRSSVFVNTTTSQILGLNNPGYYAHGLYFSRSVYYDSPVPTRPHFKNPISSLHVSEALALLQQAFRR